MRELTNEEIEYAIQLHRLGINITRIAKKFKCRVSTLSNAMKNLGEPITSGKQNSFNLNEDYFDVIDSPEKAYFLGLLFTDGSVSEDKHGRSPNIRLEISESDSCVLYMLRDELCTTNSLCRNKRENRSGTMALSVRSKKLAASLAKYGVIPNKTYLTDRLPDVPGEYIPSFIHGLIDGDGSLYYSNGYWHINFCSHFESVCRDFERLCSKLIQKENQLKIQCSNGVYRVTFNGQWAAKLAEVCMLDNYGIARKRSLAKQILDTYSG